MKNMLWASIALLVLSSTAFADELNGTIHFSGNGIYVVRVANDDGHQFHGNAIDQGDGTIYVTVVDDNGVTYTGIATDFADGDYQIELKDNTTGDVVTGTLSQD